MTNLATTSPARAIRGHWRMHAATGALLGAVVWLECIGFGIPRILFGSPGYNVIPIAAIAGGLLGATRALRWLWAAALVLAALIGVAAFTPIVRQPARMLIRSDPVAGGAVQAVVVLSGGVTSDGDLKPPAADRLLTAVGLIRRGIASTLIVSRERFGSGGAQVTSDADQQRLVALLERPVRLLIVDSVYSTRDEALHMRRLARTLGITNVAVVTSPLHTYRSCATFEKVGFVVTCVPSDARDVALASLRLATDRVTALQLILYEWAALAEYRVRGWL